MTDALIGLLMKCIAGIGLVAVWLWASRKREGWR